MREDKRRKTAIRNFYMVYRELQQYARLRLHTRVERTGEALIECYRYNGEVKAERVLRISDEDEVAAYEKAEAQVNNMLLRFRQDRKAG